MRINFDGSHIDQVEHDIAPPMAAAITIPTSDPSPRALVVYVTVGPFSDGREARKALRYLKAAASQVAASTQLLRACEETLFALRRVEGYQDLKALLATAIAESQGRSGSGKEPQGSVPEAAGQKMRQKFTIQVQPEFPPIPDRSKDYAAWVDREEERTTHTGRTPGHALMALAAQVLDEEEIASLAAKPNTERGVGRE